MKKPPWGMTEIQWILWQLLELFKQLEKEKKESK